MPNQVPEEPSQGDSSPHSPFLRPDSRIAKSRRHLPHWRLAGSFNYITWRLSDSIPRQKLEAWYAERREWLREHPKPWNTETASVYRERFPKKLDAWLDAGYGACYLRDPDCGQIVASSFFHFDGDRYDLAAFVVMPNHVHALLQLRNNNDIGAVNHSLKSYTANKINHKLGRNGPLWQQEGFDHVLRGMSQLDRCMSYILRNPREARLKPGEYVLYEAPGFRDEIDLA